MAFTRFSKRLMAFLLACSCLIPLSAVAREIDFSNMEFHEPVDTLYWKLHPQDGIEVLPIEYGMSSFRVRHPISFKNARFYSEAGFLGVRFDSTANFKYAQFDSTAVFFDTKFYSEADFGAAFRSEADFNSADFHSTADFCWAQFDSTADFSAAQFRSAADFSSAQFNSRVDFFLAMFHSEADFSISHFDSKVDFSEAQFDSTVEFYATKFYSDVDFFMAMFHSKANFREAQFKSKVSFKYAKLPHSLEFREVTDIAEEIDFTSARPPGENDKCRIALTGTDIDKIKINMRLFELWFPADTTFMKSIDGVDTTIVPTDDEKTSVYESVLRKLKDDGFMDSYRILDIDYREFKYRNEGGLNWYVANTFHRFWWNYGYAKELIFLWTVGFLLLFSVLNINFYRRLSENVYAIPFLGKWDYDSMRWPKSWIYYWLQVVTYTSIIFFGLKMDIAKFKQGVVRNHPFLFVYLMFIYVLGLICVGFIANIIFAR